MTNEQRTAVQGAIAALLGVGAAFGFMTAEETQTYAVAAGNLVGAASLVVTAVKTWKQREIMAEQRALQQQADEDTTGDE